MCFPEGRSFKCSAVSCETMTHDSILHIMKTNFFFLATWVKRWICLKQKIWKTLVLPNIHCSHVQTITNHKTDCVQTLVSPWSSSASHLVSFTFLPQGHGRCAESPFWQETSQETTTHECTGATGKKDPSPLGRAGPGRAPSYVQSQRNAALFVSESTQPQSLLQIQYSPSARQDKETEKQSPRNKADRLRLTVYMNSKWIPAHPISSLRNWL